MDLSVSIALLGVVICLALLGVTVILGGIGRELERIRKALEKED